MKTKLKFLAACALALSMAACSSNGASGDKTSSAQTSSEQSSQTSSAAESTASSQQSEQTDSSAQSDAASSTENSTSTDAGTTAADTASSLQQAYQNLGLAVSQSATVTGETGNSITDFCVDEAGSDIHVYVTQALNGNTAEATFNANTQNETGTGMTVMNEWSNGSSIVRVIRNNMANASYVEVLDPAQQIEIHIENTVPEQLDTTLQAIQAMGYPVEL